jgi:hypothetical protein
MMEIIATTFKKIFVPICAGLIVGLTTSARADVDVTYEFSGSASQPSGSIPAYAAFDGSFITVDTTTEKVVYWDFINTLLGYNDTPANSSLSAEPISSATLTGWSGAVQVMDSSGDMPFAASGFTPFATYATSMGDGNYAGGLSGNPLPNQFTVGAWGVPDATSTIMLAGLAGLSLWMTRRCLA